MEDAELDLVGAQVSRDAEGVGADDQRAVKAGGIAHDLIEGLGGEADESLGDIVEESLHHADAHRRIAAG
jgi:hypothetical protein